MIARFWRERKQRGEQGIVETLLKRSFCIKRQKPPYVWAKNRPCPHIYGFVLQKVGGMVIYFSYSTTHLPAILFPVLIVLPLDPEIVFGLLDYLRSLMDWLRFDTWSLAFTRSFSNSILSMFLILVPILYLFLVSFLLSIR
jgi:hypothetical protein